MSACNSVSPMITAGIKLIRFWGLGLSLLLFEQLCYVVLVRDALVLMNNALRFIKLTFSIELACKQLPLLLTSALLGYCSVFYLI